jgi:hypothetical protein
MDLFYREQEFSADFAQGRDWAKIDSLSCGRTKAILWASQTDEVLFEEAHDQCRLA